MQHGGINHEILHFGLHPSVTTYLRRAATMAAFMPPGPPPATNTLHLVSAGGMNCTSYSRPISGFSA
jgi:hypothetical protein